MAVQVTDAVIISHLLANADLSARQYTGVRLVDASGVAKWDIPAGAGGEVDGVLLNKPTAGQAAVVQIGGVTKMKVNSAGIAAAAKVQVDGTTGEAVVAASGDVVLGKALETGVDNQIISVLLISKHILA